MKNTTQNVQTVTISGVNLHQARQAAKSARHNCGLWETVHQNRGLQPTSVTHAGHAAGSRLAVEVIFLGHGQGIHWRKE
jgi:hypothetical protein